MKVWVVMIVGLGLAMTAQARLGETSEQCVERYGVQASSTVQGQFLVCQYAKDGFAVRVYFVKKREKLFDYTEAVGILYTKPGRHWRDGNTALTHGEIQAFLAANADGRTWKEINLIKLAAEAPEAETEETLAAAHDLRLWRRDDDGATAQYLRHTHELLIRTDDDVPLPKTETAAEQQPSALEGF